MYVTRQVGVCLWKIQCKDVAAKYASRKDAVEYLTGKIKSGGMGVWGPIPMPAQAQLSDAQAKELAQWVLEAK